jgi:hypothetical protein
VAKVGLRNLNIQVSQHQVGLLKNVPVHQVIHKGSWHIINKVYQVLPKIYENLNVPHKPLALQTCTAMCFLLYLSTISQSTGVFIRERVSEFWLFSWHGFHVCLLLSKWRMLRSKEFTLNFASSSTKLQLKPSELVNAKGGHSWASFKPSKNIWVVLALQRWLGICAIS